LIFSQKVNDRKSIQNPAAVQYCTLAKTKRDSRVVYPQAGGRPPVDLPAADLEALLA
jgi:hypothetical protein